jgi:hypothetical protein
MEGYKMTDPNDNLTVDLLNGKTNDELNDDIKPLPYQPVFCRHPYNYDTQAVSLENGLECPELTLTQQHQAQGCDINHIVQQFGVTGMLPQVSAPPTYGDFTGVFDYQSAQDLIIAANRSFMELPAEARSHFGNNPANFLNFMENDPSPELLAGLGLGAIIPPQAPSTSTPGTTE